MQININAVHFKADKQLENFITDRLQKMGKYHDNILGSDVFLKVENTDKPENKITEIRLKIRGNDLISSKQCKTFEEATDLAVEALRRQLKKVKTKQKSKKVNPKINDTIDNVQDGETVEDLEDQETIEDLLS
jgi:putative sigma-54 modulation protein